MKNITYYRDYLDISYFSWSVPDKGYVWIENTDFVQSEPASKILIINQKMQTENIIRPLANSELWLKFAQLETSCDHIESFANSFGWLGVGEAIIYKGNGTAMIVGESFLRWELEIRLLKTISQLWEWTKEENEEKLKKSITWNKSNVYFQNAFFKQLIAGYGMKRPEFFNVWTYGDLYGPAQVFIQEVLNEKLKEIHPRLLFNKDGNLQEYIYPKTLIAAIWYQFFQVITGQKKFIRCEICNEWMDVTEKRSDKTQHTKCGNLMRQKKLKNNTRVNKC